MKTFYGKIKKIMKFTDFLLIASAISYFAGGIYFLYWGICGLLK